MRYMKKKNRQPSKSTLTLSKETLLTLTDQALENVNGGVMKMTGGECKIIAH
jgi:hypothetical protein